MKKIKYWLLSSILICGSTVFSSCTDNQDSPVQEQAKNDRKEFVQHTRANMKDLAENLNLTTWSMASGLLDILNDGLLYNDNFDKGISRAFLQQIQSSVTPMDSETALKTGKKYSATIDLSRFNYRFTEKTLGWEMEESDNDCFEVVFPNFSSLVTKYGLQTYFGEYSIDALKISLRADGKTTTIPSSTLSNDSVLVQIALPEKFVLAATGSKGGSWEDIVNSDISLSFVNPSQGLSGGLTINGNVKSNVADKDATEGVFSVNIDAAKKQNDMAFGFTHNGRKMVELEFSAKGDLLDGLLGYKPTMSWTETSNRRYRIYNFLYSIGSIDNMKLTLVDDLTTTLKCSDFVETVFTFMDMGRDRRAKAGQDKISAYVDKLNGLVSGSMTCKGINQEIPMRFETDKIGIFWYAVPSLHFGDEEGYTPLTKLLDSESVGYAFNMVDYAAPCIEESVIVLQQFAEIIKKMKDSALKALNGETDEKPLEDNLLLSAATNKHVGYTISSDGYIYKDGETCTKAGKTPVALVAYVGYGAEATGSYKGLALALTDANGGDVCQWYTEDSGKCLSQNYADVASALTDKNGIANTNALVADGHNHVAATAARNYGVARPEGASEWFLPAMGQWNLMCKSLGGTNVDLINDTNIDLKAEVLNTKITAAGGTGLVSRGGLYWSSTEANESWVWYYNGFGGMTWRFKKSNLYYVRPVFAF